MTKNQTTLVGIVIAGLFGLGGNLAASFGPSWVSWGKKPSFVDTEVYKELERDNSRLSKTLEEQLMHITAYYLSRDVIVEFKKKENDQIIVEVTNTTVVKNALSRTLPYEHSVQFLEDTDYQSVTLTTEGGQVMRLGLKELAERRALLPAGIVTSKIPSEIQPKGKLTIESRYVLKKPLWYQEPMVTGRLIAGPMKITIRKASELGKLAVGYQSLAFGELLNETRNENNSQVITIPGPVFSGQGVAVTWKWKG